MPRFQRDDATSETIGVKSGKKADKETIYIFRCDESGLYAFTTDREGRMLPLRQQARGQLIAGINNNLDNQGVRVNQKREIRFHERI